MIGKQNYGLYVVSSEFRNRGVGRSLGCSPQVAKDRHRVSVWHFSLQIHDVPNMHFFKVLYRYRNINDIFFYRNHEMKSGK